MIIKNPIYLSPHTIAVINIFNKHDHLETVWMNDVEEYQEELWENERSGARELIDHFEEYWTPKFLMLLHREIEKELDEWQPDWRDRTDGI